MNRITLIFFLGCILGCTSRLPGPRECEQMAARYVRSVSKAGESAALKRLAHFATHACLTTPFDHQAVRCVEMTSNIPRCLEEMSWRAPERKAAIARVLEGALGQGSR